MPHTRNNRRRCEVPRTPNTHRTQRLIPRLARRRRAARFSHTRRWRYDRSRETPTNTRIITVELFVRVLPHQPRQSLEEHITTRRRRIQERRIPATRTTRNQPRNTVLILIHIPPAIHITRRQRIRTIEEQPAAIIRKITRLIPIRKWSPSGGGGVEARRTDRTGARRVTRRTPQHTRTSIIKKHLRAPHTKRHAFQIGAALRPQRDRIV